MSVIQPHNADQQLSVLNGDNDWCIGPKSCGFQPVAGKVQAGAVIARHIVAVCVAAADVARAVALRRHLVATLSRDVEHANNALSPIFNKEKEQKRLKQAQLIGELGAQVMDIVRTEGELKAQKAAEAKGDSKVKRPKDGDSVKNGKSIKRP